MASCEEGSHGSKDTCLAEGESEGMERPSEANRSRGQGAAVRAEAEGAAVGSRGQGGSSPRRQGPKGQQSGAKAEGAAVRAEAQRAAVCGGRDRVHGPLGGRGRGHGVPRLGLGSWDGGELGPEPEVPLRESLDSGAEGESVGPGSLQSAAEVASTAGESRLATMSAEGESDKSGTSESMESRLWGHRPGVGESGDAQCSVPPERPREGERERERGEQRSRDDREQTGVGMMLSGSGQPLGKLRH